VSEPKPYDAEQLRTVALGVLGAWYVLQNPENARDVIKRLLATVADLEARLASAEKVVRAAIECDAGIVTVGLARAHLAQYPDAARETE